MAGGRAQSSGHSCPRTEATRTAAVQGGGQDTLAQGGSDTLFTCNANPFPPHVCTCPAPATPGHAAAPAEQEHGTMLGTASSVSFGLSTRRASFCYPVHLTKWLSIFCLPQQERMEPKDLRSQES